MSSRGIKSDLDLCSWLWPTFTGDPPEFKIEDFQKKHIMDPKEFLVMKSTPARGASPFYQAVLGLPYTGPDVGDYVFVVRGHKYQAGRILRFEDGGAIVGIDDDEVWTRDYFTNSKAAEIHIEQKRKGR